MIRLLITFVVLFLFVRWAWKVWGKKFSEELGEELTEEVSQENKDRRDSLKAKIDDLKQEADDLKDATEELQTTQMIDELQKQRFEKEKELRTLEKTITRTERHRYDDGRARNHNKIESSNEEIDTKK
jgi:TolA-binding protein